MIKKTGASEMRNGFLQHFKFALQGIFISIRTERNMKIHLFVGTMTVLAGLYFKLSPWKWAVLFLIIALVTVAELINTAIEAAVDLYSENSFNPLAKKAKDVAAGAVLWSAFFAVILGVVIFLY